MLGLSTRGTTTTNQLHIDIPEQLRGIELQIIILPMAQEQSQIDFFTDAELKSLPLINLGNSFDDKEDYSKW